MQQKNELDNKADKSELSNYATKDNLGSKADRSELSNYATRGDINSAIQNVRIKQDSLDSGNNYTSGKIYSPEWSDGYLTFDMSGSYATYKTRSLVNHMSAMQEQITQLQLEVKKKIDPDIGFMLQGRGEDKDIVFNIGNIADPFSKKWTFLVLEPYTWNQSDNPFFKLQSIARSYRPFNLGDASIGLCTHDSDVVNVKTEYNDEEFRIKDFNIKSRFVYLTLVNK